VISVPLLETSTSEPVRSWRVCSGDPVDVRLTVPSLVIVPSRSTRADPASSTAPVIVTPSSVLAPLAKRITPVPAVASPLVVKTTVGATATPGPSTSTPAARST